MTAGFFRDTVRGLRSWRRTPGSALLVILALGLSGGAFLALVNLSNALLWRALPVAHPDALVGVAGTTPGRPSWVYQSLPVSLFASLDSAQDVFEGFAGFHNFESTAVIHNTRHRLGVQGVSGHYFDTLGVHPERGRAVDAHDVDRAAPVATISFRCWPVRGS